MRPTHNPRPSSDSKNLGVQHKHSPLGSLKRTSALVLAIFACVGLGMWHWTRSATASVTTVFSDDFSTNTSTTFTTSGAIGASAWSVLRGGTAGQDFGVRRNTTPAQLELTNDATAAANQDGWVLASTPSSSFASPYSTTLSSNPGLVTWTFNIRQIRADPAGFTVGSYGVAFVLAGTSNTNNNTGSGYAVVLGQSGATDPVRLARYSSGVQGILTNIITSNTAGLTDFGTEFLSVRVTYLPSTNTWELFLRNDAGTFADPAGGTVTSQGTAVDSTSTGTALPLMGAWWQGSTTATQTAFFDNTTVTVTQPSIVVTGGALSFPNTSVGGTSAEQTYTVSGSNLTANVVVTSPSTDFQISTTSGSGFGPIVNLTPSSGTVATTTIFVRFTPQSTGLKSGNITNASTGATTQNVAVSGTGVPVLNVTTDPTVTEGDTGTTLATFTVTLTPASSQTVTVHYSTQDNSATAADNDYVAIPDTLLTFNPTETTKNITVTVNGDTQFETNEQFFFNINTPSNANISDNQGIGTITNDDPIPTLNVTNNPTVTEGNAGPTLATFNVTLSNPSYQNVTVHYSTQDNSATVADNDYVAIADTLLTFVPGETSKNIDVTVNGDTTFEANEQFFFNINNPLGANISDNQGIGTITNDDGAPGTLVVTKTADTNGTCVIGNCSLREAINAANSNTGDANTINFNIPNTDPNFSGGVYTITPATPLPTISGTGTVIDGSSQTTFGGNTNAAGPEVELNGVSVTTAGNGDGLVLSGGNGGVKGMLISRFGVFSGFPNRGILITSGGNVVQGNFIGTNASGTAAAPNGDGILINNANDNIIGGALAGQGNVISGNSSRGLVIQNGTQGTFVFGNFIGVNVSGAGPVPNANAGIELASGSNQNAIGATTAGARNLISGNLDDGVKIGGNLSNNNNVQGNFIGTNAAGTAAIGNASAGVRVSDGAGANHIGGLSAGARNIISGNASGVVITGTGTNGNHVEGNYIGTNVSGSAALGNQETGVDISGGAANNFVGDADPSARNVISGNLGSLGTPAGVLIRDVGTDGNTVQSNYIGVAADGATALGNTGGGVGGSQGVMIMSGASNNIIGGSDPANEANIIANNSGDGVRVAGDASIGNAIRGNSIYANTLLGINLAKTGEANGTVTPNDALDADTGPNTLQNFPVITTAVDGTTTVSGTLNSTAGAAFAIDVYANVSCDASGNGEGRTYLGSVTTGMTNGSGNASFSVTVPALVLGQSITATATDASGNTSEFSACYTVTSAVTDITFNADGNLNAGTYNNVTINSPAVVTMTGNVVVNGCVFINGGSRLNLGTFTFTGPGCFTLSSGATLGIGSAAGITTGASGNVQVGGARSFATGASYVYNGATNQAVGNALPGTVANLTINNSNSGNTVSGNSGQIVTGTLTVQSGVYSSASDYVDVVIAPAGTLSLAANITVGGNWTNNGAFTANGFGVTFDGGSGQTVSGNTNFFNLTKSAATAQTFNFAAGSNTGVTNTLTLSGAAGNVLALRSTVSGTQWNLNASSPQSAGYVDVKDSNAGFGSAITATNSINSGNNINWIFTQAAIVYVDPAFTGPNGSDPDGGGPATSVGYDAFATIQAGINNVAAGGTVNVAAGTYTENVTIPKPLTLTGAGAATVTLRPAISDPNCGGAGGGSLCGPSNLILVQANNVTVSGLTLNGDNPTLTSGTVAGGADLDARNGIITNHLLGIFNNLEVHHTTVKNIYLRGMYASSGGTFNFHHNTVENVQAEAASIGMFNFGGAGVFDNNNVSACNDAISSNHSRGVQFTNNTVTTSRSGIHTDNAGDGGGAADTISGNTVTDSQMFGYGIWVYVPYKTVNVQNNTTTNVIVGFASFGMAPSITAKPSPEGEKAQSSKPAPKLFNVSEPATEARLQSAHGPLAPPAPPYAAIFTGNRADGQHNPSSTGVYFTTSQIDFGSADTKVKFFSNTVIHNADGFYLEAETGFTLETAASFNRIIDNDFTAVTVASAAGFAGTLNGSMENNWWGCNLGPNNAGCGNVVGAGVDFDPWIVLGISASPATIPPGGSTTITADMTHNSVNAVPSVTDFVPPVAVTFGATNGTVLPTSGTITNGQATTTFTSNSTSSGSASATVDNQTVSTPVNVSAANTYTWTPTLGSTNWLLPTNWSPTRVLPQASDVLVIDGTTTPAPIITNVPTQTIAALHLINGPQVTLQAGGTSTLTINGATGSDLTVPAGSLLTLDGSNGITIKLSGLGTIGTIGGGVIAQGGFHRLFGDANGVITIQNGAFATAGPGLTSSMFGTGIAGDGDTGSVIFQNGSTYSHNAGDSPFGAAGDGPVVTFQTGSTARWFTSSGFQASGRTYANLDIGALLAPAVNLTDSGSGNFEFDNLTVRSPSGTNSSLTFNGAGAGAVIIHGDISSLGAGTGATVPDVTLTAGSAGINVTRTGGGTLQFSNDGSNTRTVDFVSDATVTSGTTLSLGRKLVVGGSSIITVNGGLTGGLNGYVIGNEKRPFGGIGPFTFHVGTTNGYSPLDANVTAVTGAGDALTAAARQGAQPVLTSATSLQRYWTLTEGGSITSDLTFHYNDPLDIAGNEANYRLVVVESGNATSFPHNCPSSPCVNPTANTITRTGVQTFSDWTAAEPAAPTAVKLTGFSATSRNGTVMLQWQSGYEAHNLGYNIYREENGKRVQITPSLVAGSALIAGAQTRLTAGLNYTWFDDRQTVDDRTTAGSSGQSSAINGQSRVTYWLEDVDLNGMRTLHGPIAIADCGSGNSACKQIAEHSPTLSELNSTANLRNSKSGAQFSSWPAAVGPQSSSWFKPNLATNAPPDADDLARQRAIEARPGVKISVSEEGWYRVTQPELIEAGLDPDALGSQLQLYVNGRVTPIKQSGDGIHLTSSDYIEFYGQGIDSPTAATQTYYLTVGDTAGSRVREPFAQSLAPPSGPTSFVYTIERRERTTYFSGLRNGEAENFFGQIVSNGPTSSTIPINHPEPDAPAQLEIALQGVSSQAHEVQVEFNGERVGTINFAGADRAVQTFNIPAAGLEHGENTVRLTSLDGPADVSLVDVMRLTYTRQYRAADNHLELLVNDPETKRFSGFDNPNIRVIDITTPAKINELTAAARVNSEDDGSFSVDVQVPAATNLKVHKLLVFTAESVATVTALRRNNPSDWWAKSAGADYVIVAGGDLAASVEPLAQLRRSQGLDVQVVDVEDLYDEFTFGEHSPQAIRDYLAAAQNSWTRRPRYVLLAGDASYDPKNYLGQGANDLAPTKLIDTALMETASDDWLADFNGDGVADVSLGRLPVRTEADMSALVAKIIGYENAAPDPSRGALLVADTSFEGSSSAVGSLLPSGMTVATVNRSSADDATIHNQIIAGINQGPRVTNYIGHGSNGVWTGASLLSTSDAPALTNTNRLSVFTMMTCFNGFFQDAYNDSLSEALLKAPGGAVAVWASTTLTEPAGQNAIDQEFYRQLFGAQPATIGDAARAAKTVTNDADVRRTWTLFGDPAMRLR
jgi:CSLREA domain-containing protein